MKFRFFVAFLLAVPVLAACGSSGASGAVSSAKDQAAAIKSAEAGGGNKSAAPSSDASSESSSGGGSNTCPDQTVNGYKITDVLLTDGATCAQVSKVAASPQIAGTADWSVDGFQCDIEAVSLVSCELHNSEARINFIATKQ